eukprot:PhM_4_TR8363/c4_g1_i1/m.14653
MLLRISTQQSLSRSEPTSIVSDYHLCPFSTEDVLSFCIDATRVLVVDITSIDSDFSRRRRPNVSCCRRPRRELCFGVDCMEPDLAAPALHLWIDVLPPRTGLGSAMEIYLIN